jgi:GNAT superfamily N-acetyltransferase
MAVEVLGDLRDAGVPFDFLLVTLSIRLFSGAFETGLRRLDCPSQDERYLGDHMVIVSGSRPGQVEYYDSENPPGRTPGTFSREYLADHFKEGTVARYWLGPSRGIEEPLLAPPVEGGDKDDGDQTNEHVFERLGATDQHEVVAERLWSAAGPERLTRLSVRRTLGSKAVIVGWLQLRVGPESAIVDEFFVWTPYRGQGFGTELARHALFQLALVGFRTVRWYQPAADIVVRDVPSARSRQPAWFRDLEWRPASECAWPDEVPDQSADVPILSLLQRLAPSA